MRLQRGPEELLTLLAQLEEQGWEINEEQDARLNEFVADTEGTAAELFFNSIYLDRIRALKALIEKKRRALEVVDEIIRAKLAQTMVRLPGLEMTKSGNPKTQDANGYVTVYVRQGQGRVELEPGMTIDDVDPMYVEPRVERKLVVNTDLAREHLAAGQEIRGLRLVKEPGIVMLRTERGKQAALEIEAGFVLGQLGGPDGGSGEA